MHLRVESSQLFSNTAGDAAGNYTAPVEKCCDGQRALRRTGESDLELLARLQDTLDPLAHGAHLGLCPGLEDLATIT